MRVRAMPLDAGPTRASANTNDTPSARLSTCRELRFENWRRVSSTPTKLNSPSDLEPCGCCRDVPRGTPPDVVAAAYDCAKRRGQTGRGAWATVSTCRARGPHRHRLSSTRMRDAVVAADSLATTSHPRSPVAVLASHRRARPAVTQARGGRILQRRARDAAHDLRPAVPWRTSLVSSWHRVARDLNRLSEDRVHWRATIHGLPERRSRWFHVEHRCNGHRQSSVFTP